MSGADFRYRIRCFICRFTSGISGAMAVAAVGASGGVMVPAEK